MLVWLASLKGQVFSNVIGLCFLFVVDRRCHQQGHRPQPMPEEEEDITDNSEDEEEATAPTGSQEGYESQERCATKDMEERGHR